MPTPVFVFGLNRNGTTWLQNILCNHPKIVGAQHKVHWGIHESDICHHIQYWGDFDNNDQYIKFLELYSSGDYFKLVEGEKEYFYENRPKDFIDFYLELMDNFAEKKGADYWTTKIDPLFYRNRDIFKIFIERAKSRYKKIKLISIKRDYFDALTSAINMFGREWRRRIVNREIFALGNVMNYAHYYKLIDETISKNEGLRFEFNSLKNNRSMLVKKIVNYLDLDFSGEMMEDYYLPNSSYLGGRKKYTLPNWEKKVLKNILLPFFQSDNVLNTILRKFKDQLLNVLIQNDCPLYWRLIKYEKFKNKFRKELKEKGMTDLYKALFDSKR